MSYKTAFEKLSPFGLTKRLYFEENVTEIASHRAINDSIRQDAPVRQNWKDDLCGYATATKIKL